MASEAIILRRLRKELGDLGEPFRQTYRGTGEQDEFDLPTARVAETTLKVYTIAAVGGPATDLTVDTDFTMDWNNGVVRLNDPLPRNALLVVEGTGYGLFSDEELSQDFIRDAILQHTNARTVTTRYKDERGFIRYEERPVDIESLPEVEELPVAILATIEALWSLSTDAATDIDVTTSEGTHIPRSQRFAQIRAQIDVLTEKYETLCSLLNVGLYRIEVSTLRRVSRTTNRLVPVFTAREYDDATYPTRVLPPIDKRNEDADGPPSPATYQGLYG